MIASFLRQRWTQLLFDALAVVVCASGLWIAGIVQEPPWFAWPDLFVVHILAAVPLAVFCVEYCKNQRSIGQRIMLCGALLAAAYGCVSRIELPLTGATGWQLAVLRSGLACMVTIAALGLSRTRSPGAALPARQAPAPPLTKSDRRQTSPTTQFAPMLIAGLAAWLLPAVYTTAHGQHDRQQFADYVEQERLGAAMQLAQGLLSVDPQGEWRGLRWIQIVSRLQSVIDDLESQVSDPLPDNATFNDRLDRARTLAILGRETDAASIIADDAANNIPAALLLATIFENRREWRLACDWYRRSHNLATVSGTSSGASVSAAAEQAQALRGIGFCERKLGNLTDAEAAYLAMLAVVPTAESHFLLAQFYEDTQRTNLAQNHARRAMQFDPESFTQPAQRLLNQLQTRHFGCWGVYRNEREIWPASQAEKSQSPAGTTAEK